MAYRPVEAVGVRAWGRDVGAVALDQNGIGVFEYDPAWATHGLELAPLLAPTSQRIVRGEARSRDTFLALPPFLADSLPDAFGNAVVDAYLAREGIERSAFTALDRLVYAGSRAMGALEFYPPGPAAAAPSALDVARLVDQARRAISGDLANHPGPAVGQLLSVGASAGGARAKAVVAVNAAGEVRSGSMPPEPGWTDYLLKFDGIGNADGSTDGYTRIEYAYHLMAGAAELDLPAARLLEEGGRAHFMTERFDRADGARIHLQSLCALAGLDYQLTDTHDYGQYFDAIDRLGLGAEARHQAFRRAAFNVFAYNRDDHTKNVAFLMGEDGAWRLAPAYDLTFSYRPDSPWVARHQMAVDGVFADPTEADLRRLGDRWAVPGIAEALDAVRAAVARWEEFAGEAGVEPERAERIGALIGPRRG